MATVSTRVVAGSSLGMTIRGLVTLPVTNLLASCP